MNNFLNSITSQDMSNRECNATCCKYEGSETICFTDYNFADYCEIKDLPTWELVIRWAVAAPIALIGIFGNLTVIAILLKNRLLMLTNVNIFIFNMAVSDLILAMAGPIPFTIRCTHQFWVLGKLWCHLDGFIQVTVMQVSVTSLSIISVDRLMGILSTSYSHLKKWKAILIIAGIWIFSCGLGIPFYIFRNFGIHEWADVTEIYCEEYLAKTKYYWLVIIVALNWIPLLIMNTCYIHLFLVFRRHSFKRDISGSGDPSMQNKKKLLKMLFVMILAFLICWMPLQVFIIYREILLFRNYGVVNDPKAYNAMLELTQYFVYLYPVINPFIYSLMHQNFKNGFRVTFPCFFKEEADFVLRRGQGSRAYVWSRTSVRHTIHSTSYEANRRAKLRNRSPTSPLRRAFSYDGQNEPSIDKENGKKGQRSQKKSVTFRVEISSISQNSVDNNDPPIRRGSFNSHIFVDKQNSLKEMSSSKLLKTFDLKLYSSQRSLSLIPPVHETSQELTRKEVFEVLRSQGSPKIPKHLKLPDNSKQTESLKICNLLEVPKSPTDSNKILEKISKFNFSPKLLSRRRISKGDITEDECLKKTKITIDMNTNKLNEEKLTILTGEQTKKRCNSPRLSSLQDSLKNISNKIGENFNQLTGDQKDLIDNTDSSFA